MNLLVVSGAAAALQCAPLPVCCLSMRLPRPLASATPAPSTTQQMASHLLAYLMQVQLSMQAMQQQPL
jgi:hypothetical protein